MRGGGTSMQGLGGGRSPVSACGLGAGPQGAAAGDWPGWPAVGASCCRVAGRPRPGCGASLSHHRRERPADG